MSIESLRKVTDADLSQQWWTIKEVAVYIRSPSVKAAQMWAYRNKLRRSKTRKTLTCRQWVDACLERRHSPVRETGPNDRGDRANTSSPVTPTLPVDYNQYRGLQAGQVNGACVAHEHEG
jgi:hypothetical protein